MHSVVLGMVEVLGVLAACLIPQIWKATPYLINCIYRPSRQCSTSGMAYFEVLGCTLGYWYWRDWGILPVNLMLMLLQLHYIELFWTWCVPGMYLLCY